MSVRFMPIVCMDRFIQIQVFNSKHSLWNMVLTFYYITLISIPVSGMLVSVVCFFNTAEHYFSLFVIFFIFGYLAKIVYRHNALSCRNALEYGYCLRTPAGSPVVLHFWNFNNKFIFVNK